jgi:hypothetical protein
MRVSVKECNQKYGLNIYLPDRDFNLHSFLPVICDGLHENQKVRFYSRCIICRFTKISEWLKKEFLWTGFLRFQIQQAFPLIVSSLIQLNHVSTIFVLIIFSFHFTRLLKALAIFCVF